MLSVILLFLQFEIIIINAFVLRNITNTIKSMLFTNILCCSMAFSQDTPKRISLHELIDNLSLHSSAAKIEKLNFQTEILRFENYKKSYLPSFSLNFNPISFNRSLRVLQQPSDGSYSYVEDYSNNSSAGVSVRQKIGFTGGEINIGSNINYLNEFSRKRNSFSTTPFSIGYSQ